MNEFPRVRFNTHLRRCAPGFAALATGLLTVSTHAAVETFTIDPALSLVSLSGTVAGGTLQEQAAGSLTTPFSGTIVMDVSPNSVKFVGGSSVKPVQAHNWEPGLAGAAGSAPASYGAKGAIVIVIFPANAKAASRNVAFDFTTAAPLPLTSGNFSSNELILNIIDTSGAVLDYQVSGAVNTTGSKVLSGLSTNKVASTASLKTVGGVETLTIPIRATYSFRLLNEGDTLLTFTGNIVATRGGGTPEVPVVDFTLPTTPGGPLHLVWSKSYKLQRTTQLAPPIWVDLADTSPLNIPLSQPGEYFRVVPK